MIEFLHNTTCKNNKKILKIESCDKKGEKCMSYAESGIKKKYQPLNKCFWIF